MTSLRMCTCLVSLALALHAEARSKPKPTPKPLPLTTLERTCQAWGQLTYALAVERDRGVSLVQSLGTMRQAFLDVGAGQTEQRLGTELAYHVYAQTGVSPAQSQQAFELGCLRPDTVPTMSKERW